MPCMAKMYLHPDVGKQVELDITQIKGMNMIRNQKQVTAGRLVILILVFGTAIALKEGYTGNENWYWLLILTLPLLLLAIVNRR